MVGFRFLPWISGDEGDREFYQETGIRCEVPGSLLQVTGYRLQVKRGHRPEATDTDSAVSRAETCNLEPVTF